MWVILVGCNVGIKYYKYHSLLDLLIVERSKSVKISLYYYLEYLIFLGSYLRNLT